MAPARTFGRRAVAQQQPPRLTPAAPAAPAIFAEPIEAVAVPEIAGEPSLPVAAISETHSVDDELREWKRSRKINIPWRQISLMASLCFGMASFVLPASVNNNVEYLLYALSAASLYAWYSQRGKGMKP